MNQPVSCPGVNSETAGKSDGCKGCPNQSVCSSQQNNQSQEQESVEIINRLKNVKNIILVMSGKGGVGKSTLSTNIARGLAEDENLNIGLLDIDICGPSIPHMFNLYDEKIHLSNAGWSPVYVKDNLSVMSCAFMLESLDEAIIWRGPKKNGLIKQFLRDVNWDDLDFLIIDTPPGTSDEHLSIISYLKKSSNLRGSILITTPQEASLIDVRKQIDFCKKVDLKILGIVKNMCKFNCIKCNHEINILKPSQKETVEMICERLGVKLLANIPLDSVITKNIDLGVCSFEKNPDSVYIKELKVLLEKLKSSELFE